MCDENYHTIKTAVTIPTLQSLVSVGLVGGAVSGIVATLESAGVLSVNPVSVGVFVGCSTGIYVWRTLLKQWSAFMYPLPEVEALPEPLPERTSTPITVIENPNGENYLQGVYGDIPASLGELTELGRYISEGGSFTEASLVGSVFQNRKTLVAVRDEFIRIGLLQWKSTVDTARGVRVTSRGMRTMRTFAGDFSPTPRIESHT